MQRTYDMQIEAGGAIGMPEPGAATVPHSAALEGERATRRFLILLAMIVTFIVAFFMTPLHSYFSQENVAAWRDWVASTGFFAPFLFLVVLVTTAVCGIPRMYPTILGGALFGLPLAMALSLSGSTLGAVAAFVFARHMGKDFVDRRLGRRFEALRSLAEQHGFALVALLRVVPFSNFVVTNYACGMTPIRIRDYTIATAIGMIPSTLMFVLLGKGIVTHDLTLVVASTVVFLVVTACAIGYFRRIVAPAVKQSSANQ